MLKKTLFFIVLVTSITAQYAAESGLYHSHMHPDDIDMPPVCPLDFLLDPNHPKNESWMMPYELEKAERLANQYDHTKNIDNLLESLLILRNAIDNANPDLDKFIRDAFLENWHKLENYTKSETFKKLPTRSKQKIAKAIQINKAAAHISKGDLLMKRFLKQKFVDDLLLSLWQYDQAYRNEWPHALERLEQALGWLKASNASQNSSELERRYKQWSDLIQKYQDQQNRSRRPL